MYQRNNKRTGLKNVRCFPYCSEQHVEKGFCGRPVILRVARSHRDNTPPIFAWGEFRRVDDPRDVDVGTTLNGNEIRSKTKDPKGAKADTLTAPYFEGIVDGGEKSRTSQLVKFIFNQRKKGWNYAWQASKHTAKARHAFFAYVFIDIGQDLFQCIGVYISPTFILYCRKRKSESGSTQVAKRRKSSRLDDDEEEEEELVGEHDFLIDEEQILTTKNKLTKQQQRVKTEPIVNSILEGNRKSKFDPSELELLNLATKSNFGSSSSSSNAANGTYHGPTTYTSLATMGALTPFTSMFLNTLAETPVTDSHRASLNQTPSSFSGEESEELDFAAATAYDPSSKRRIAAVLNRLHGYLTADGAAESLNLPQLALDWFLNDIEFAVEELDHGLEIPVSHTHSTTHTPPTTPPSSFGLGDKQTTFPSVNDPVIEPIEWSSKSELISQLANYLLEESSVTAAIHQIILQDEEGKFKGKEEGRLKAFVDLFQNELANFLAKRGYTEKDLDEALASTPFIGDSDDDDASKTLDILNKHVNQVVKNQKQISQQKPLSWLRVVTVRPEIDMSGHWRLDDSLLAAFDECRARRGIPYMMRRLLGYMESKIVISQTTDRIVIGLKSKLFASDEVEYMLDGVERIWHVAPPIPWHSKLCETYKAWIEGNSIRYCHIYNGVTRTERIVRKNATGDRIEMDVSFQEAVAQNWVTVFSRKGYALRITSTDY